MTPQQAEALLRNEMRSGSQTAEALRVLLVDTELGFYRSTARSNDPYTTATMTGRGQGLHQFLTRIAPPSDTAQQGRGNA